MRILISVNDVWYERYHNGVSVPKHKRVYDMLLEEVLEELPDIKMMLMEPFVPRGPETEASYDWFHTEVALRAAAVKELSAEYQLLPYFASGRSG